VTGGIASWLLSSKVSPPRISINASRRDALLDLLAENAGRRIIMVEAPAGFGKTLLLSQWREVCRHEGDTVAWLSINHGDQPDVLLPYIAFAFHQAGLDTGSSGLLASSHNQGDASYLLGRLLQLIELSGQRCVMVFDDFENTREDSLAEIMEELLRLQPDNLQLVFACRRNPGLSLSGLAVEGNVLHIGPPELTFTREEVDHFFRQRLGNTEIENIMERTGGWPVALQLMRSFGGNPAVAPGNPGMTAGNRLIADYFREQLFNNLTGEQQSLLLRTAMLDTITVDCAACLLGHSDAAEIIHGLDYLEGIFSPLEDEQESWRVHPLVREHLLAELRESSADEYRSLCRKAARWMAGHERGLEAMRYALEADDVNCAAEILEDMGGVMIWIREGMSRLTRGLQLLEGHDLEGYPRVQLARCLLCAKTGDISGARRIFEQARAMSGDFNSDRAGGDDTQLKVERYSIEIMIAEYGCSPTNPILPPEAFTFMLEHTGQEPTIHGYIRTLQCLTSLQMGDFAKCIEHGEYAIREYLAGRSRYGELFIYFYFGMAEHARGRNAAALNHYNQGTRIIHREFPGDTGLKLLGDAVLGEYYWEAGDAAGTRKHIRQVISNIRDMEAYFDIYMAAYHASLGFLLHEKGLQEALNFLQDALVHARRQSLDRLEAFLLCTRLSLLYLAQEKEAALALIHEYPALFTGTPSALKNRTWREIEVLALALHRAGRLQDRIDPADPTLSRAMDIASETGNVRLQVKLQVQAALDLQQRGEDGSAAQRLAAAVGLAAEGACLRPFLDELQAMGGLLASAKEILQEGSPPERTLIFLDDLVQLESRQRPIPGLADEFSAREIQILSELSRGQPDKLIARQTGLSAHGVRYHLKNIYTKMGVENRVQAISRAREMELI